MLLKKISLFNFKNYAEADITLSSGINCFVGLNGSGKTNILDSIHYLSFTKSAFNSIDSQSIKHGESMFSVRGDFEHDGQQNEVICALQQGQKKVVKVDKNEYDKLSEHIGRFPVVLIAPNDTDIIRDSNEIRRKFFDSILAQFDSEYFRELIRYSHYLKQRNSLLKHFAETKTFDADQLESYDVNLIVLSKSLYAKRNEFVKRYVPILEKHYLNISEGREKVGIQYHSQTSESDFEDNYVKALEKDKITQRTNVGIHKDQYEFQIDEKPLKKFGSQGQQKSFLIALKLTQFEIIKEEKGFKPLLLLDDIFDKLDDFRIKKLVEMVACHTFGQLFITDARPERSKSLLQDLEDELKVFEVENGEVL